MHEDIEKLTLVLDDLISVLIDSSHNVLEHIRGVFQSWNSISK